MLDIRDIILFQSMEESEINQIVEISYEEIYREGEEIFEEGTMGEIMYIILEGEIEVKKDNQLLTVLGPGKFFGEMALLDSAPRSASCFAGSNSKLMVITKDAVDALAATNLVSVCKLFIAIFKEISQKLRNLNESYVQTKKSIGPNFDDF